MNDKYKRIVNTPQKTAKRAFDKVKDWKPDNNWWQLLRVPGGMVTFNSYILLWLLTRVGLDNPIIDKLAEKNSKIKLKKSGDTKFAKAVSWIKRKKKMHPSLSAYIVYYMMLAALVTGGKITMDVVRDAMEQNDDDDEKFESGTYGAYFDRMRTITPFLIADLIAKEGVRLDENGLHKPYKDSKGIWTIGFGSTKLKDGSPVTENTPHITTEEAYELARWHLEDGETYFGMYCYDVAFDEIDINDVGQALGMGSIMYNSFANLIEQNGEGSDKSCDKRFGELRQLYGQYGCGLTDQMVKDAFAKNPVTQSRSFGKAWLNGEKRSVVADKLGGFLAEGPGMYWRRWLEAGLLTGDVTPDMLLNCPVDGMYEFFKYMGKGKESFFTKDANGNPHVNKDTYDIFKEWLKNPVNENNQSLSHWKRVSDYLPAFALEACNGKVCKLGSKASKKQRKRQKEIERETYVLDFNATYSLAVDSYKAGDYEAAAKQFEALLTQSPNNALLHNDIAATYNKLGRYDDAIKHANIIVREIGDKSQYAAAQYNAGFAYEQKGDLQKALANYKLAVANGNKRVQDDVTRVTNKINYNNVKSKSKAAAFNKGSQKLAVNKGAKKQNNIAQINSRA